jgi:hypothetical protein
VLVLGGAGGEVLDFDVLAHARDPGIGWSRKDAKTLRVLTPVLVIPAKAGTELRLVAP